MNQNRIKEISSCSIYHLYKNSKSQKEKTEILWEYLSECCFCHPNRFYCDEFRFAYNIYQKENDSNYDEGTKVIQRCELCDKLLKMRRDQLALLYSNYSKFSSGECLQCGLRYPSVLFRCDGYISMVLAFWDLIQEDEIQLVKLITKYSQRPPVPGLRFMDLEEVSVLAGRELSLPKKEVHRLVKRLLERDILEKNRNGVRIKV